MMDTATLLSMLRDRDVKLWVDEDRLKCSAPVGALDAELRATLVNRKEEVLAIVRQADALKSGPAAIVPIKADGHKTPLFAVSGHGGDVFWLLPLARHLEAEQPVLGVQPPGLDGSQPVESVEALARYEVEQIRSYQPKGPYLIAGHCAGGTIAFEVAQQLIAAGQQVAFLALIGSPFPTTFKYLPFMSARLARHIRGLTSGSLAERLNYIKTRLHRRSQMSEAMVGVSRAELAARFRVERATLAAISRYKPRRYPGRIDLFITSDKWHEAHRWSAFAGTIREHTVGNFEIDDLLLGPHVTLLANSLQDALRSLP